MESLGPLPVEPLPHVPATSPQRAALLDALRRSADGDTVGALSRAMGLHENTVREHLEGLLAAGLVTRAISPGGGRGRPAWRYRATAHGPRSDDAVGHRALAAALAAHLASTAEDPAAEGRAAGLAWGTRLAPDVPPAPDAVTARRHLLQLFADLGFDPEPSAPDAAEVRLRRCPLLDSAREFPTIVCKMHEGVAAGVLGVAGRYADADDVRVVPFAEPGACLLRLGPAD